MKREKHSNQQKIVNKLIHFLMGCLQGGPIQGGNQHIGNAVKRRFQQPLAIESRGPKQGKFDNLAGVATVTSPATPTKVTVAAAGSGPVIYDVTHHGRFLIRGITIKSLTQSLKMFFLYN